MPVGTCPLTGEAVYDPDILTRRPLAVKVSNYLDDRPQSGLSRADLVFEHLTEGFITRFTALFLCHDSEAIGPIRSARLIDLDLVPLFDAIFAHVGASAPVMQRIALSPVASSNLDDYLGTGGFFRIAERPAPYNLYSNTPLLREAAETRGLRLNRAGAWQSMSFSEPAPPGGSPATTVELPYFTGLSDVVYRYDPAHAVYERAQAGAVQVEALTGEALTAANVVVLTTPHVATDIVEDDNGARSLSIVVSGEHSAILFRDGLGYPVTWTAAPGRLPQLLNRSGQRVPLKPGSTWIEVVPPDFSIRAGS